MRPWGLVWIAAAFVLPLAWADEVDINVDYPDYLYIASGVDEVAYDFDAPSAPKPGFLSRLDPSLADDYPKYGDYIMPAATKPALKRCLGIPDAPGGSYEGTTSPPPATLSPCRFAPSDLLPSGLFQARYKGTGRDHCTEPLYADASLLVLANGPWKVSAKLQNAAPDGVELHVLPLTFKAPDLRLCKMGAISNPSRHDRKLTARRYRLLSRDPTARNRRYAYYTQYQGVYLLPLLFYLELDPNLTAPLWGTSQTVTVEYVVRTRP